MRRGSARPLHPGNEVFEAVVVQDIGDRVSHTAHDVLQRAVGFRRVGTVQAFLISSFADAPDGSQWAIEDPDDVSERDLRWRLDEGIASLRTPSAGHQARVLKTQQNVLEKDHRNVLTLADLLPRDRTAVVFGQLDQCPEAVFAFFRELHA